jgi:ferritin-like metal-binding protein YciE
VFCEQHLKSVERHIDSLEQRLDSNFDKVNKTNKALVEKLVDHVSVAAGFA